MIRKLRLLLRNVGIRSRLVFGFICVPLFLMIIFFLLYYDFSVNIIIEKNDESSKQLVKFSEEIFHLNKDKLTDEMNKFVEEPYIIDYLEHPDNQNTKNRLLHKLQKSPYLSILNGWSLYDKEGKLCYNQRSGLALDLHIYRKQFQENPAKTLWISDDKTQAIMLLNEIHDKEQNVIGYFAGQLDVNAFSPAFAKNHNTQNMLLVVGKDNEYLFGTANIKKGTKLALHQKKVALGNEQYLQQSQGISGTQWKIVNLVDENDILKEIHDFRNVLLLYAMAFFLVLLSIATLVYHSIYDPLHNILKSMRTLNETNISKNKVIDHGRDELHELSTNFNELLNRVEELIHTIELEQEQKRKTQFQLLQAQINPHFLFNTLNTLHYMAILNEDRPVSEGITALAKLLRNTITDSKETISVEEELENVKNYIIIQKLRFGDLFETVYNIDDNVKSCLILRFLLQPIVENSILHAFEEDKEYQVLMIRAEAEGKYLKIEIGDNGKGFRSAQSKSSRLSGIGMSNIAERIRLMYGESYSMEVQSAMNKGTIITLRLPLVKGDVTHV